MINVDAGIGWTYWLATVLLLLAAMSGWGGGIPLALALCVVHIAHFAWRERSITAFSVQVRLAYLVLLVLGLGPGMQWVHAVQLIGTSARVTVGYCLLARLVSLMPWNCVEPWSRALIRRTFLTWREARPCSGGAGSLGLPRLQSGVR